MRRLLAIKLLIHDRSTTAGSVLGVVAIVFLVGQQLAIFFGLINWMATLVDHSGCDVWICTRDTDNVDAVGSLPIGYVDRVMGLHEVEWAEPVISSGGVLKRKDGKYQPVLIVGLARPRLAGGPWHMSRGDLDVLLDYEGTTVDQLDLSTLGEPTLHDVTEISNRRVRIAGFTKNVRGFQGTIVFTNLNKAREITRLPPDRCSNILVKFKPAVDETMAIRSLRTILSKADVIPTERLAAQTRIYYITQTGIGASFGFTTLIGSLVGVVIITLTMYTNILNRQKDFAVLRAIGARRQDIIVIVLYQAFFISIVGIVIGFFLLAMFLSGTRDSNLPSYMYPIVPPIHMIFTIVLCMLASLLAMRRAVRIDPASAFR
jgi:putative ABC transport system permease protein